MISSAPPEKAGAASAASDTSNEFGGALGLAALGSVGAAVYRARMTDDMPAELPAGAVLLRNVRRPASGVGDTAEHGDPTHEIHLEPTKEGVAS